MKIEIEHPQPGKVVVRAQGRLDSDSAPAFKEQIRDVAQTELDFVILDLEAVDFIDSSGLSALVTALKAIRQQGGMLNLCKLQPQVLTALRLTLLDRVFSIFPSVEDALSEGDLQIP